MSNLQIIYRQEISASNQYSNKQYNKYRIVADSSYKRNL